MARQDMNTAVLIGNLTKDPETRSYNKPQGGDTGTAGTLRIAVNRRPPRGGGEGQTDFIDVKVFDGLADTCAQHLSKGRRIAVQGRLQIDEVDRRDGNGKAYFTYVLANDVQFLDAPGGGNGGGQQQQGGQEQAKSDLPF